MANIWCVVLFVVLSVFLGWGVILKARRSRLACKPNKTGLCFIMNGCISTRKYSGLLTSLHMLLGMRALGVLHVSKSVQPNSIQRFHTPCLDPVVMRDKLSDIAASICLISSQ